MAVEVTVVGTGTIGVALARRWRDTGMDVTLASRRPAAKALDDMPVMKVADALPRADVVVTAIPGAATGAFLAENATDLRDTPVVDASNNVAAPVMHHAAQAGPLPYYRAFNPVGVENFTDPAFDGITADLFCSGPQRHQDLVRMLP